MEILQEFQDYLMEFGSNCLASAERRVRNGWNQKITVASADRGGVHQLTVPMRDNKGNVLDFTEAEIDKLLENRWDMRPGVVLGRNQSMSLKQFLKVKKLLLGEYESIEGKWLVFDGGRDKRLLEYNGSLKGGYAWSLTRYTLDSKHPIKSAISGLKLDWAIMRSGL